MKSFIVALFTLASAAVAQQEKTWLDWGLPECSVECLEKAVGSATKCSAADWNCFCIAENYRNTYDAAVGCVLAKCGQDISIGTFLFSSFSFPVACIHAPRCLLRTPERLWLIPAFHVVQAKYFPLPLPSARQWWVPIPRPGLTVSHRPLRPLRAPPRKQVLLPEPPLPLPLPRELHRLLAVPAQALSNFLSVSVLPLSLWCSLPCSEPSHGSGAEGIIGMYDNFGVAVAWNTWLATIGHTNGRDDEAVQ